MISRLYVKNFRSLAEVEVKLEELTVLVGQNGSGKSNFVDILRFMADAIKKGIETAIDERHGIKSIRRWAPKRPYDIKISLDIRKSKISKIDCNYSIEIKSVSSSQENYNTFSIKSELCRFLETYQDESFEIKNGEWKIKPNNIDIAKPEGTRLTLPLLPGKGHKLLSEYLRNMLFYNIYPNDIRVPQREPAMEYPLDSGGRNLAFVLRRLIREKSELLSDLKEALKRAVPGIVDLGVKPVSGYLTIKFFHQYDKNRYEFDAFQESDGTLRLLGILTALIQQPPPKLLAIEEPELTVHPGVLGILADLIQEAAEARTQVVLTTHSPDLISRFPADCLRVVEWQPVEGTIISEVAPDQLETIKEQLFTAGDLLRIEGLKPAHY